MLKNMFMNLCTELKEGEHLRSILTSLLNKLTQLAIIYITISYKETCNQFQAKMLRKVGKQEVSGYRFSTVCVGLN